MNLLQNIVGAINIQMHSVILPCSLTIAAAGKRKMGSGCWFYNSEISNYVFAKASMHSTWPCSFNLIIAIYSSNLP
jgi:hypothetical protein